MKVGIDSLDIQEFTQKMKSGGQSFLNQHFSLDELSDKTLAHLGGIFAAKESIFKTGYLETLDFQSIQILKESSSRPEVFDKNGEKISELDISITYTKSTATAVTIWNNETHP